MFVREELIQNNLIQRIYDDLDDCIILQLNGQRFINQNDIVLVFAYIAPERSSFRIAPTDNGIEILADKLLSIVSDYPNVDLVISR